jgi:hypothetical protein
MHAPVSTITRSLRQAFTTDVLPRLAYTTFEELHAATGPSSSYLRGICSGRLTPHPRHWSALLAVATAKTARGA